MTSEPIFDLAHLGHMEMLTPKPDESLNFFVDVMGMTVSGQKGESVYLRGWDDYERYSLKLTASNTSGMEHMALRARSPQALERRVAALKGSEVLFLRFDAAGGLTAVTRPPRLQRLGRLRSITTTRDGDLLLTTDNGARDRVVRVSPR